MTLLTRILAPALIVLVAGAYCPAAAQGRKASGSFRGSWSWAVYARDQSELPLAYRDMRLEEVPRASLDLNLKQKGSRLTGEYGATARYLARLEEGELSATAEGGVARVSLESGFGGRVTATITLRGDKLYWKVISAEGEHYFPTQVVLRRTRKRP